MGNMKSNFFGEEITKHEDFPNLFVAMTDFLFDQLPVPMNFIDTDGRVIIMNQAFLDFLGTTKDNVIGRLLTDIDPTVRLPIVLKTGMAEIRQKHKFLDGRKAIVNRLPLYVEDKIVAAAGMVLFDDLSYLSDVLMENKLYNKYKGKGNDTVKKIYRSRYNFGDIIAQSVAGKKCKAQAKVYANADFSVLITGESGVGKELYAHSIHSASKRKEEPFVRVNCAAIPESLIESELFGYEQGAFTGASKGGKIGKFELANGGTIFLDEIADIPLQLQVKLLRVLQERELEKIGSNEIVNLDVRVIAATNCNLEQMVKEGKFRSDLFYRLNVLNLNVPSLKECKEDITLLVKNFTTKMYQEFNIIKEFPAEIIDIFASYLWPGNVRELKNIVERVSVNAKYDLVQIDDIPLHIQGNFNATVKLDKPIDATSSNTTNENTTEVTGSLASSLAAMERSIIRRALLQCNGNKAQAAKVLQIPRMTLYRKIEEYGL